MKTAIIVIIILAVIAGIYFYLKAGKKQEEADVVINPKNATVSKNVVPIGVSQQFLQDITMKKAVEANKALITQPNIFGARAGVRPSATISMI